MNFDQKEKDRRSWKIIGIVAVMCILFLVGTLLLALYADIGTLDTTVTASYRSSGNTAYVDTDDIRITLNNGDSKTYLAQFITIKLSGENVHSKTISYTGPNLFENRMHTTTTSIELKDDDKEFTLTARTYYKGKFVSRGTLRII